MKSKTQVVIFSGKIFLMQAFQITLLFVRFVQNVSKTWKCTELTSKETVIDFFWFIEKLLGAYNVMGVDGLIV